MGWTMRKILLAGEFAVLFFGIPLVMYLDTGFTLPSMLLLPVLIVILVILRFGTEFRWKELVHLKIRMKDIRKDVIIVTVCAAVLLLAVVLILPEKLFNLPKANPLIWMALGLFYPVFSAYPQEVLFRTYIFRRYHRIFVRDWLKIAASGVSFSFVHILYYHPVSMVLTLAGGIYLAMAYQRTGSVLYTAILHGILGMLVFSVGLGEYFWLDMHEYF